MLCFVYVKMWSVTFGENGAGTVEFLSDLHRHQRAVNAVQFSPNGEILASGDDGSFIQCFYNLQYLMNWRSCSFTTEAVIILWTLKPKSDIPDIFSNKDGEVENRENWTVLKILRGHMEDIYDICWSPDSSQILSGSVDNTAILWDVAKGMEQFCCIINFLYCIYNPSIISNRKIPDNFFWTQRICAGCSLGSQKSICCYTMQW